MKVKLIASVREIGCVVKMVYYAKERKRICNSFEKALMEFKSNKSKKEVSLPAVAGR